ncbi:MAG: hypothetical protein O3C19_06790 [Bacteroidetes bacterium]|nr:hypothetical protein [Bacteroidota bacterium]
MKSKLEWLAGIEVHSTGAYGRSNCLVWSDDVQRFQSSGDHGELMDEVYETVHHDDVDACEEAAFELWLEKVGVLIE